MRHKRSRLHTIRLFAAFSWNHRFSQNYNSSYEYMLFQTPPLKCSFQLSWYLSNFTHQISGKILYNMVQFLVVAWHCFQFVAKINKFRRISMRTHPFRTEQWLPNPVMDVFSFFLNDLNLETITPPWLHFQILTPNANSSQGSPIDYRLRLYGEAINWQSEITLWNPPNFFVDEQRQGAYSLWVNEHTFTSRTGAQRFGIK